MIWWAQSLISDICGLSWQPELTNKAKLRKEDHSYLLSKERFMCMLGAYVFRFIRWILYNIKEIHRVSEGNSHEFFRRQNLRKLLEWAIWMGACSCGPWCHSFKSFLLWGPSKSTVYTFMNTLKTLYALRVLQKAKASWCSTTIDPIGSDKSQSKQKTSFVLWWPVVPRITE